MPESEGNGVRLGHLWSKLLEPYPGIEKAVFLDSLLPAEPDGYPAYWRRFIRVGFSYSEQVANLFELCFEKGYEQVVFAESACAAISPEKLSSFMNALEEKEMVFLPSENGSVIMAAMQLHLFADWDFYRFYEPGSIVEVLSDCHEREIDYAVMEAFDLSYGSQKLKELLQNTLPSGKSRGTKS